MLYSRSVRFFQNKFEKDEAWVWIQTRLRLCCPVHFLCGYRVLFTGSASTDFSKFFFKFRSHDTIHTFKNYFATMFSIFSNK